MAETDPRTFLVTGPTTGIGRAVAEALAGLGARVLLAGRSQAKGQAVIEQIAASTGNRALEFISLDLGDLDSVRSCAAEVLAREVRLHALINNAGVAGVRGFTRSGFELAFGTNHVGHFLLTALLLDRLRESAPARIVNVASDAHYSARGIDFDAVRRPTASFTGMREYSVSKLANVLHAQELGRRLEGTGVTTYALHPGVIASDIWRRVPWPARALTKLWMGSTAEGARTPVWCATAPELVGESGRYYEECRRKEPSAVATAELGAELWRRSEAWVARAGS